MSYALGRTKRGGYAEHIKEQTLEICLEAVMQHGYSLEYS